MLSPHTDNTGHKVQKQQFHGLPLSRHLPFALSLRAYSTTLATRVFVVLTRAARAARRQDVFLKEKEDYHSTVSHEK